jgi:hypothetical protein
VTDDTSRGKKRAAKRNGLKGSGKSLKEQTFSRELHLIIELTILSITMAHEIQATTTSASPEYIFLQQTVELSHRSRNS